VELRLRRRCETRIARKVICGLYAQLWRIEHQSLEVTVYSHLAHYRKKLSSFELLYNVSSSSSARGK
jgi:hypothetical protein